MNTNDLVAAIDVEIARLTQIRDLLGNVNDRSEVGAIQRAPSPFGNASELKRRGRPKGSKNKATSFNPEEFATKRRRMSAAGKERIAAAQRARWAKQKGTDVAKKSRPAAAKTAATRSPGPTPATKKKIARAKTSAAKPLTKSAVPAKPASAKKVPSKARPAKNARSTSTTPVKKPVPKKQIQPNTSTSSDPASLNSAAEGRIAAAAE